MDCEVSRSQYCDSDKGTFHCDINISIRLITQAKFGSKIEIKNLNAFSPINKAKPLGRSNSGSKYEYMNTDGEVRKLTSALAEDVAQLLEPGVEDSDRRPLP
ncbi:hypothetical protein Bca4012_083219 [Brassica carinata]|uniref:Aspartyl/Glutamyl-tRNA(Gln) amidotransferase subunit B/E catalytic domain-containing protein n=1 Tax=Brassica carinata TaxID=52824 RepID=A0A8X7VAP5_BRACI|nr:hypothetical protein Bca52824_027550 [Brassica carinata]